MKERAIFLMNGMKEPSRNEVALNVIFPLLLIGCFVKCIPQSFEASLGHCSFRLDFSTDLCILYYI